MKWLSEHGYSHIFGRLDNIPLNLVVDYVKSMRLVDEGEDEYRIYYEPSLNNVEEPDDIMKRITGTSGKRKPHI